VSLQHLDSEAEMRKFFGSKVISAAKSSANSPSGSSRRQQTGIQRSHLTRPQPSWLSAKQREGLSIQAYDEDEIEKKMGRQNWAAVEEKWWTVEYSKRYKSMTMEFMKTVMSGDPDNFWRLLQNCHGTLTLFCNYRRCTDIVKNTAKQLTSSNALCLPTNDPLSGPSTSLVG
jgi:hypothetical protein